MTQAAPRKPLKTTHFMRRVILYASLALAFFLLGFAPMWFKSLGTSVNLSAAEKQISLANIQNDLGSAAIYAQRGEYEPALESTSDFFTALRAETDLRTTSAFLPAQTAAVELLFAQRDDLITLLARRDPASAQRLSDLYAAYRNIVQ